MLHEAVQEQGVDHAVSYKTRLGVWMFIPYALFYAGFVAINMFKAELMERVVFLGLNLAVVYGFALIVVALVLALVYNQMCAVRERAVNVQPVQVAREG